ncbi:hypothetical protein E2C01_036245 [Portunus trituberculatus]|uniref:Uncharacterized protein n=1 Tax=Portunus trituberculatus TaxID=210409 RepID=A0A5B7F6A7_PORTR|nr:hypothetical protein [Portunus trituberculatus]
MAASGMASPAAWGRNRPAPLRPFRNTGIAELRVKRVRSGEVRYTTWKGRDEARRGLGWAGLGSEGVRLWSGGLERCSAVWQGEACVPARSHSVSLGPASDNLRTGRGGGQGSQEEVPGVVRLHRAARRADNASHLQPCAVHEHLFAPSVPRPPLRVPPCPSVPLRAPLRPSSPACHRASATSSPHRPGSERRGGTGVSTTEAPLTCRWLGGKVEFTEVGVRSRDGGGGGWEVGGRRPGRARGVCGLGNNSEEVTPSLT